MLVLTTRDTTSSHCPEVTISYTESIAIRVFQVSGSNAFLSLPLVLISNQEQSGFFIFPQDYNNRFSTVNPIVEVAHESTRLIRILFDILQITRVSYPHYKLKNNSAKNYLLPTISWIHSRSLLYSFALITASKPNRLASFMRLSKKLTLRSSPKRPTSPMQTT